jgi:uncharacterized protein YjbI with pentapeptide repeats
LQPLYWIEGCLEILLDWLKSLAFLEILQLMGNLSIPFAAVIFVAYERQQRNAEVYQAWQVITAAYDQPGSGGRIEALEFLNSEPRRNPWFLLKWEKQSLAGLAAPKAYLAKIQLPEASLVNANLQEAILWEANLQGASLWQANLKEAQLFKAELQEAGLQRANLQGASLWQANLKEAQLPGANLQKAQLQGASLEKAELQGVNLQEAQLYEAKLQEASLEKANLQGADLREARLQGAYYTNTSTKPSTCKNRYVAKHPCSTIFPKNFNPKAAGMVLVE